MMRCPGVVTAADAEERGWIPAFSHVVHFNMNFCLPETSLLPFHGFSTALKFFRVEYGSVPLSRIVNLIHAFPIFEDLSLFACGTMTRSKTSTNSPLDAPCSLTTTIWGFSHGFVGRSVAHWGPWGRWLGVCAGWGSVCGRMPFGHPQ